MLELGFRSYLDLGMLCKWTVGWTMWCKFSSFSEISASAEHHSPSSYSPEGSFRQSRTVPIAWSIADKIYSCFGAFLLYTLSNLGWLLFQHILCLTQA